MSCVFSLFFGKKVTKIVEPSVQISESESIVVETLEETVEPVLNHVEEVKESVNELTIEQVVSQIVESLSNTIEEHDETTELIEPKE